MRKSLPLVQVAAAAAAICVLNAPVSSQVGTGGDWPTFRRDLHRTGSADAQAGPAKPGVRWRFRDPEGRAAITSSPAVVGDRLFVGADNGVFYCLDTETGQPRWRSETDWELVSSPAVVGGRVYFGEGLHTSGDSTRFRCLEVDTGKPLWSTPIPGHVESSPAVAANRVYFGAGGAGVFCLDRLTGAPLWRSPGRHVDGSPTITGKRLFVGVTHGRAALLCLDAQTGRRLWEAPLAAPSWGAPAVSGTRVWIAIGNGTLESSAAKRVGAVLCLDAATGKVLWKSEVYDGIQGSVAVSGGLVVAGSRDGDVYAFNAVTGERRWSTRVGAPVVGTPAVAGGRVYVAADNADVRCLSAADGRPVWNWSMQPPGGRNTMRIVSSPAVGGGRLYAAGTNGSVVCLEDERGSAE